MDTRTKKQKPAGRKAPAQAKKPTAAAAKKKARLEALDMEAYAEAQLTGAAWVSAIRFKVRELVREAGRLDGLSHPDLAGAALILKCVLHPTRMNAFINAVYALEVLLDDIFATDCDPLVPDLAGACRRAGETNLALYAGKKPATGGRS